MSTRHLLALAGLLFSATAGAQAPAELDAFALRSAEPSLTTLAWDRGAVGKAAAAGKAIRVPAFDLRPGLKVDLELEPFAVAGPDTRFVLGRADGRDIPLDFDPASISLFRGTVAGKPGSQVFLALSGTLSTGFIDLGPGHSRYRVSSRDATGKPLPAGEITVFETSAARAATQALPPGVPLCGLEDHAGAAPHLAELPAKATVVPGPGIKHLELAVETDFELFSLFGDAAEAAAYLVAMYAEVSAIYLRDVDVWVEVVFARIWDQPNDPFNGPDPLPEFRNYWNANMTSVARDTAQMFSGRRDYPFGGQASLSVLCSQTSGYSVVGYALGFFPDPSKPSPVSYDISVTAHEIGHNAGTGHTHDNGIDSCNDPLTTPQRGTIMSYCGQTFSGQNANRDLYFHSVVQANIDNHVVSRTCMPDDCNLNAVDDALDISGATSADANSNGVPDECEDCNGNSILDPADIAGASADVNGNGIPDECEPDCNLNGVPDEWDVSQGTSTDAYGNFVPDECEADCNANAVSDYTEIQANMDLDRDRNAVLDSCQDCDGDGTDDLAALGGGHGLWIGSGQTGSQLRRFYAATGVRDATSSGALVDQTQDLIISPNRTVLVSSAGDHRVLEFDLDGNYLGDLVPSGSGGLTHPAGLAVAPGGALLVASRDTHSVLSYDAGTGTFLGTFVAAGAGGLSQPFGLAFDRDGDLYVTTGTDEVLRYDGLSGAFVDAFVPAAADGGLSQPRGLTFKGDGNLLVASFGSDEVLEFDGDDGAPRGKWAQVGTATVLTQTSPWGLRVGPNGNVFMSRTGEDFGSGGGGNHDHLTNGAARLHLTEAVIYEFDVRNGNFLRTHIGGADHGAVFPTGFDFIPGWEVDCNLNLLPDGCDVTSGTSTDGDLDGIPDECQVDCNANGVLDRLDVVPFGNELDCNANLTPDACDVASGTSLDEDANGVPDECQCGDGTCSPGEDCTTCPADCPSLPIPGAVCGNGLCEAGDGEDCVTCPADCDGTQGGKPGNRFCCGFGGENPVGCADSRCLSGGFLCTETPVGGGGSTCCGDLACEAPEDGFSCELDCGPPPFCGDGTCDPGEDTCSCATDCGAPPLSELGFCTDGEDNDCDGLTDCSDSDCDGSCLPLDCSTLLDKETCNIQPTCEWSNRDKVCLPI